MYVALSCRTDAEGGVVKIKDLRATPVEIHLKAPLDRTAAGSLPRSGPTRADRAALMTKDKYPP
jgi:hypothetical protein